jgi:predicted HTH transcriptional regulator
MEIGSEVHIDIFDDRLEVYSPGGMADGTLIQDQDTDNISSKRRNPIIADVFSRMHLMERRGSGFRKIKGDYRNALNYRVEVEPLFTSTPTSFFVTLYNLNYNVPIEKVLIGSEKVAVENEKVLIASENLLVGFAIDGLAVNKNTKENMRKLFAHLSFDGIFGRNDIMEILSISITAAGNLINKLKEAGLIEAVRGQGKGKYRFVNQ